MAYASLDDVQAHRPQHLITDASKPNKAQVELVIESLSQQVDGRLAAVGIAVPVSGAQSLKYLRAAVGFGVAGVIESQQAAGLAEPAESHAENFFYGIFERMIAAVEATPKILSDAPTAADSASEGGKGKPVIGSFFTKNPSDDPTSGQRALLSGSAVPRFEVRREF